MVGHGMRARGEAGSRIVGAQALFVVICLSGMRLGVCSAGIRGAAQQWAHGAAGLLHLPERIAPMLNLTKRVERAHTSQRHKFLAIEFRHLQSQVIYICKRHAAAPRGQQRLGRGLTQTLDVMEPDAQRECAIRFLFERAEPLRMLHANGAHVQPVTLRILDEHRRRVEAHGLVVEQAAGESCQKMHLEVGRGIGDEREAGRVRLGKPYMAKDEIPCTMLSCASGPMPLRVMPSRRRPSRSRMRCMERRMPTARRSSSASAPVKLATVMAMRNSCS